MGKNKKGSLPSGYASHWQASLQAGLPKAGWLLVVETSAQSMLAIHSGKEETRHPISTSRDGLGEKEHSYRTPRGLHEIADRIGGDQPAGSVFSCRRPTGRILPPERWKSAGHEDLILTRILRLRGLEPGRNAGLGLDSYARNIYLHGTNHEHLLGTPVSHGCIRMANQAIAELFDRIGATPAWCLVE